ncbi:MAG: DUF433 domain-containing protein [Bacteroidia bacterium]|nr:DUF433 domain-containing protein [Bacteroidia bacterium]
MSHLEQISTLIPALTAGERALALQWLANSFEGGFPGIDVIPGRLGASPHITRTRIPVWLLVQARRLGMSEAGILNAWPTLTARDLVNAWAYYEARRAEIDREIQEQEQVSE